MGFTHIDVTIEIALAVLVQLAAQIALNATLKTEVKNLASWLAKVASLGDDTARLTAYLKGRLESIEHEDSSRKM